MLSINFLFLKRSFSFLIIYFFLSIDYSFSQNIGLKAGSEYSEVKQNNNSFGAGIYCSIIKKPVKTDLILSIDYNYKNNSFSSDNFYSKYHCLSFNSDFLYIIALRSMISLKIGPSLSYNLINSTEEGITEDWINTFKSENLGMGIMSDVQFVKIFNSPISIDIFINPKYIINIKNENDPSESISPYSANYKTINLQIGISYSVK